MLKVAKGGRGTILSANLKNAGKLVGKELLLQGVMHSLSKAEEMAIEQIFKEIGKAVTHNIKPSLQQLFTAGDEDSLSIIVDSIFDGADYTSQENIRQVPDKYRISLTQRRIV